METPQELVDGVDVGARGYVPRGTVLDSVTCHALPKNAEDVYERGLAGAVLTVQPNDPRAVGPARVPEDHLSILDALDIPQDNPLDSHNREKPRVARQA